MNEVHRKHNSTPSTASDPRFSTTKLSARPNQISPRNLPAACLWKAIRVVYQLTAKKYLIDKALSTERYCELEKRRQAFPMAPFRLDDGSKITADIIINAAGAAAPQLSPQLKIVKRKGHLVITDRYNGFVRHQLIELGYLRSAHGREADSVAFNVQPRKTGQVLLGSSRQFDAESATSITRSFDE